MGFAGYSGMGGVRYATAHETERYVRGLIARVGAAGIEDMARVMKARAGDHLAVAEEWSCRWVAERILKGELPEIPDLPRKVVADYVARNTRRTLQTRFVRKRTGDPLASRFFGIPCLPPGEAWPTTPEGVPMRFVGQFDLDRAGLRPEAVADIGFLAVFVTPSEDGMVMCDNPVAVVSAPAAEACVAATPPEGYVVEKPREIGFRECRSYPAGDDPFVEVPDGLTVEGMWRTNLGHRLEVLRMRAPFSIRTRIGGWPDVIQTNYPCWDLDREAPARPHPFVVQIGTEQGLDYGSDGYLYLMRGRLLGGGFGWSDHLDIS